MGQSQALEAGGGQGEGAPEAAQEAVITGKAAQTGQGDIHRGHPARHRHHCIGSGRKSWGGAEARGDNHWILQRLSLFEGRLEAQYRENMEEMKQELDFLKQVSNDYENIR